MPGVAALADVKATQGWRATADVVSQNIILGALFSGVTNELHTIRVGIDVGSKRHRVAVGLPDGKLIDEFDIDLGQALLWGDGTRPSAPLVCAQCPLRSAIEQQPLRAATKYQPLSSLS